MKQEFLTIDDHPDMGLENTICEEKTYFCKCHRVYMSQADVEKKKCFCKPTFDMISVCVCPNIHIVENEE